MEENVDLKNFLCVEKASEEILSGERMPLETVLSRIMGPLCKETGC